MIYPTETNKQKKRKMLSVNKVCIIFNEVYIN